MLKKLGVNVVWCVAFMLVSGLLGNGSIFAQGGVDSYTKLMLHADGSDPNVYTHLFVPAKNCTRGVGLRIGEDRSQEKNF